MKKRISMVKHHRIFLALFLNFFLFFNAKADCTVEVPDPDNFEFETNAPDFNRQVPFSDTDSRGVIFQWIIHGDSSDWFYLNIREKATGIQCKVYHAKGETICSTTQLTTCPKKPGKEIYAAPGAIPW